MMGAKSNANKKIIKNKSKNKFIFF